MTTSEPTTGELIEALRCDGVIKPCEGCFFAFQIENCSAMGCRTDDMFGLAADRLEAQEQTIAALTARAESAERERDAAKADMKLIVDEVRETHCDETCCFACKYDCDTSINDSGEFNNECPGFDRDDCFEWRGLPQEGERKSNG